MNDAAALHIVEALTEIRNDSLWQRFLCAPGSICESVNYLIAQRDPDLLALIEELKPQLVALTLEQ